MENKIIFGVGSIHRKLLGMRRSLLLHRALDIGFRNFDVAPSYGNGLNEIELGRALRGIRRECTIATKYGIPCDLYGARHPALFPLNRGIRMLSRFNYAAEYRKRSFDSAEMRKSVDGSLKRLKTDYVDTLFIHEPLGLVRSDELIELLDGAAALKRAGKILSFGAAGPYQSIKQFECEPKIERFQFPIEDISKLNLCHCTHSLVTYGMYRSYCKGEYFKEQSFIDFVLSQMNKYTTDVVVSTTSVSTLKTFRNLV